jgi:hypothetical protein
VASEILVLDAIVIYECLTQEVVPLLGTFKAWMFIQHPELVNEADGEKLVQWLKETVKERTQLSKAEFFTQYLQVLIKL